MAKKKQSIHDPIKSSQIDDDGTYQANMEIQERFYEEDNKEEEVNFTMANSSTFGTFIVPKDR